MPPTQGLEVFCPSTRATDQKLHPHGLFSSRLSPAEINYDIGDENYWHEAGSGGAATLVEENQTPVSGVDKPGVRLHGEETRFLTGQMVDMRQRIIE